MVSGIITLNCLFPLSFVPIVRPPESWCYESGLDHVFRKAIYRPL